MNTDSRTPPPPEQLVVHAPREREERGPRVRLADQAAKEAADQAQAARDAALTREAQPPAEPAQADEVEPAISRALAREFDGMRWIIEQLEEAPPGLVQMDPLRARRAIERALASAARELGISRPQVKD